MSDKWNKYPNDEHFPVRSRSTLQDLRVEEDACPLLERPPTTSNRQDLAPPSSGEDNPPSYEAIVTNDESIAAAKALNPASKAQSPYLKTVRQVMELPMLSSRGGEKTQEESDEYSSHIYTRCVHCKRIKMEYSVETLSMCITNLSQFVRFNYVLAVPLLPKLLSQLAVIAEPLCDELDIDSLLGSHARGRVVLVAKQSIRCIVHQLADHRVFSCLFLLSFPRGNNFLRVLVACLRDYHQFHYVEVLKYTLEVLLLDGLILSDFIPAKAMFVVSLGKTLYDDFLFLDLLSDSKLQHVDLHCLLKNMANYLHHIEHEAPIKMNWQPITNFFTSFLNELANHIAKQELIFVDVVFQVMLNLLKSPIPITVKATLLEPFSKILSASFAKCNFSVVSLYELCEVCYKILPANRGQTCLTRCLVTKLVACLKMNFSMPTLNLLYLLQVVLLDVQSRLNSYSTQRRALATNLGSLKRGFASDCMELHLPDCLDVLADGNFLANLRDVNEAKQQTKREDSNLYKGTHESDVKLAVGQIVAALLHSRLSDYHNDSNVKQQYNSLTKPAPTVQHNQKEYHECVGQLKKLCWVLLGALSHLGLQMGSSENLWYPIDFEKGPALAGLVEFVLTDYLKQNKESKMNMESLCYAFYFCQLWTMYNEQLSYFMPSEPTAGNSNLFSNYNPVCNYNNLLLDFWSRITPSIMALLDPDILVSENVHRHIACLMKCLQEYDSAILYKLFSLWSPMLEMEEKGESRDSDSKIRDALSPTEFLCDVADETDLLGSTTSGVVQSTAKRNARHVLEIVNSINKKLIELERKEGLVCIV